MNPSRLAEIIRPLEMLLGQHQFQMEGEPMIDGPVRMASFVRQDGIGITMLRSKRLSAWGHAPLA